jgi:CRISPR-associated protein Csd2
MAHDRTPGGLSTEEAGSDKVRAARQFMCESFYDVRAFGAVMTTGANAGQVNGPVQITFARSLDPVFPLDFTIARVAVADKAGGADTLEQFAAWRQSQSPNRMRTLGRKSLIPYGLFAAKGFISGHLAAQTGFDRKDLALLWEAIGRAFEHNRSASHGLMSTRGLYVFEHTGTSRNRQARQRESILGCAPAHQLVELGAIVEATVKDPSNPPRAFSDYRVEVHESRLPTGVKLHVLAG